MPSRSASSAIGSDDGVVGGGDDDRVDVRATAAARSTMCSSSGLPAAGSSTLPGSRLEVMRASIVQTTIPA